MQLTHLSLTNFRNFARLEVNIPKGPILLVGGNAQGKTSLLEAIYYLATFMSFQASHDRQLINFHAEREPIAVGKIIAHFTRSETPSSAENSHKIFAYSSHFSSGKHTLEVRLILQPNGFNHNPRLRKEILLDGIKRKASQAIGAFNAVLFLPHMLRVVEGSPEQRRRYLNLMLVQVVPHYAAALTEYNRALTQRNALLKQIAERGGDRSQLDYWDERLSLLGSQIIHARIQAVHEIETLAGGIHNELSRGNEVLRLSYQPSFEPLSNDQQQYELPLNTPLDRRGLSLEYIQQGYLKALQHSRAQEIARGVTISGPHRDELRFISNGIDLGIYGSRGQARTAMLALKLSEVAWIKEKTGQWPVLLLDEVLAELDPQRRDDLLSRLKQSEQALLTTTDLDLFSGDFLGKTTLWHIQSGQLTVDKDKA